MTWLTKSWWSWFSWWLWWSWCLWWLCHREIVDIQEAVCFGVLQQSPSHISCDHTRLRSPVFHAGFVSDLHPQKKWSWMKDLRISCLKLWFQKWNRLKLWVNSPWLLWRRSPFMQEMAIQPLRQTFLIRDVCIAIYSMDPSVLFGFPCFWISTPGTFINQIYPISRWPCIQECPRKMRTFWLPETQCQCSPASMAFWFAGEGSQAFKHLN